VRLFPEQTSTIKSRPTTIGTKIRTQANLLVEKLMSCQPHCTYSSDTMEIIQLINSDAWIGADLSKQFVELSRAL